MMIPQLDNQKKETVISLSCEQVFYCKRSHERRILEDIMLNKYSQWCFSAFLLHMLQKFKNVQDPFTLNFAKYFFESIEDIVETLLILNPENSIEITFEILVNGLHLG